MQHHRTTPQSEVKNGATLETTYFKKLLTAGIVRKWNNPFMTFSCYLICFGLQLFLIKEAQPLGDCSSLMIVI